jgi:hypothetical protein
MGGYVKKRCGLIEVLSRHLRGEIEENHERHPPIRTNDAATQIGTKNLLLLLVTD